jgi:hypothetical protein
MEINNFIDVWRTLNPNERIFTWHRGKSRSRLDYIFVSEHMMNSISESEILPGIHSDHCLLKTSFASGENPPRGKGLWKFNASMLHDPDYITEIKSILHQAQYKYDYLEDKGLKWDIIKNEIRSFTIPYSYKKKKKSLELEHDLNEKYQELHILINKGDQTKETVDSFYIVKSELEIIERHKARGNILRSKIQWVEEGERNSAFFLRLEKHNYCNKLITKLNVDKKIITKPKEILEAEKDFYKALYSDKQETCQDSLEYFTKNVNIPKITAEQSNECENDITSEELLKCIKSMKNKKTPGTDGISNEFYKFFWLDIKSFILDSINYAIKSGELSTEQKRGVLTLIPKKDKDRLHLKNWRPITLLNVDYKIFAKVIANRMSKILPTIIHEDQTGYLPGRFIGCNIRQIEDIIFYTNLHNIPGILLTIDFEKAFDSIKWEFVDKSLEAFNFGPNLRRQVKILYTDISTAVINNGNLSSWFKPERGVRQGCPLSPYIFILTVELLAIGIRENKSIKGIKINNTEIKLSQLADDTTCVLADLESIGHTLQTFEKFRKCAGLNVNVDKTKAKYIGSLKDRTEVLFNLDWSDEHVQCLGVTFSVNEEDHLRLNFKKRLKNLHNLLHVWKARKLSLKGKITVINTLALAPLLYLANVIYVPENVYKEVKIEIVNFLWDGKPSKIAYDVLIQDIEKGGLKLIDFKAKVKSLNTNWIKRLTDKRQANWKVIPSVYFKCDDLELYFMSNKAPDKSIRSKFYFNIQKNWSEMNAISHPNNTSFIKNQVIWNNRYLTINKKPFIWSKWLNKGIKFINDIIDDNGTFLNSQQLNLKFNININFLNTLQVRDSIPLEWKGSVANSEKHETINQCFTIVNGKIKILEKIKTKEIYWLFIKERIPTSQIKWESVYPEGIVPDLYSWQDIYKLPFQTIRETKLQAFQFKIIHRIINCNKVLYNMNIKEEPVCSYCEEIDDIQHFFVNCTPVRKFWLTVQTWLNNMYNTNIILSEKTIIFGCMPEDDMLEALNFVILLGKFYIYKQRLFHDNEINFLEYLIDLKYKLDIEEQICKHNKTLDKFIKYLIIHDNL